MQYVRVRSAQPRKSNIKPLLIFLLSAGMISVVAVLIFLKRLKTASGSSNSLQPVSYPSNGASYQVQNLDGSYIYPACNGCNPSSQSATCALSAVPQSSPSQIEWTFQLLDASAHTYNIVANNMYAVHRQPATGAASDCVYFLCFSPYPSQADSFTIIAIPARPNHFYIQLTNTNNFLTNPSSTFANKQLCLSPGTPDEFIINM